MRSLKLAGSAKKSAQILFRTPVTAVIGAVEEDVVTRESVSNRNRCTPNAVGRHRKATAWASPKLATTYIPFGPTSIVAVLTSNVRS